MQYDLFLFDLDDTLLDFRESERVSFSLVLRDLGLKEGIDELYALYQAENTVLWKLFEEGRVSKEHLKVERFRKTFELGRVDIDPRIASARYLESLPETVVLIDHAEEICEWLSHRGEIGIVTNGIRSVAVPRIKRSKIAPYVSFVCVSEECGFAKPDIRFFEYGARLATKFSKHSTIVIGDKMETDIQGAHNFGIDSCWFNPRRYPSPPSPSPKYEIAHLSEIRGIVERSS